MLAQTVPSMSSTPTKRTSSRRDVVHNFFKPDWSPEMFPSHVRGASVGGRRSLANAIEGSTQPSTTSRISSSCCAFLTDARIRHIPKILYHCGWSPGVRRVEPVRRATLRCDRRPRSTPIWPDAVSSRPPSPTRATLTPADIAKASPSTPLITVIVRAAGTEARVKACCERL